MLYTKSIPAHAVKPGMVTLYYGLCYGTHTREGEQANTWLNFHRTEFTIPADRSVIVIVDEDDNPAYAATIG